MWPRIRRVFRRSFQETIDSSDSSFRNSTKLHFVILWKFCSHFLFHHFVLFLVFECKHTKLSLNVIDYRFYFFYAQFRYQTIKREVLFGLFFGILSVCTDGMSWMDLIESNDFLFLYIFFVWERDVESNVERSDFLYKYL